MNLPFDYEEACLAIAFDCYLFIGERFGTVYPLGC
jgi:hypothetical protein